MFSTILNIFSSVFWMIRITLLLIIFLCKLAWKSLLVLVFLEGFFKVILALHKLCNIIAEKHSDKRIVYAREKEKDLNVLNQSFDDISVVSEMSSYNTNDDYVVESWNSYQVIE